MVISKLKFHLILSSLLGVVFLGSCGILFFRKVECRAPELTSELFWFQGNNESSFSLISETTGEEKLYILKDKWYSHREQYFSDSGCDCHDMSAQLLEGGRDSIWTVNELRYVERNKEVITESITFVFDGDHYFFSSTNSKITLTTEALNDSEIESKLFSRYGDDAEVKLGKGVGILHVIFPNGEKWERKNAVIKPISGIEDYRFTLTTCD